MNEFVVSNILSKEFIVAGQYVISPGRASAITRSTFKVYGKFADPAERIIFYLDPPDKYTGHAARIENDEGLIMAKSIEILADPATEYVTLIFRPPFSSVSKGQAIKEYEQSSNLNPLIED